MNNKATELYRKIKLEQGFQMTAYYNDMDVGFHIPVLEDCYFLGMTKYTHTILLSSDKEEIRFVQNNFLEIAYSQDVVEETTNIRKSIKVGRIDDATYVGDCFGYIGISMGDQILISSTKYTADGTMKRFATLGEFAGIVESSDTKILSVITVEKNGITKSTPLVNCIVTNNSGIPAQEEKKGDLKLVEH